MDTSELDNLAGRVGGSIKGMIGAATAAVAAVGVADFLRDSIEEAREAVKVTAMTENVIKTTGAAAKVTADHVGDLATSLSNYAGIDDEVIQGGENLLLTFKGVRNEVGKGNDIFDQASRAAVDLAATMGTDVNSAMLQMGKALNDPVAGLTKLTRSGITFTDQQEQQIKTLTRSGDVLGAQRIMLAEINSQVGGAAGAAADPWQRFGVVMGNLKEQVGTEILPTFNNLVSYFATNLPAAVDAVGPVISRVVGVVSGVVKRITSIIGDLVKGNVAGVGVSIGAMLGFDEDSAATNGIVTALETVRTVVGKVVGFISDNGPTIVATFRTVAGFIRDNVVPIFGAVVAVIGGAAGVGLVGAITTAAGAIGAFIATAGGPMVAVIAALGGPITLAIAGVAALTAGVIYAYQHFQGFRDVVDAVAGFIVARFGDLVAFGQQIFPQLQEAVGHVFNAIRDVITVAVGFIMATWRLFGDDIIRIGQGAFEIVRAVIETAINTVANIIRFWLAVINGDWGKAWEALKNIVGGVFDGIKGVVSGQLGILSGILGAAYDGLKRAAGAAFGAITDSIRDVVGGMFNIGRDIIGGIIRGIENMAGALINAFKRTVTDALPAFARNAIESRSPSRVFARIGETIPAGMAQGISSGADSVLRATADMLAIPNGTNAFGAVGANLAGGGSGNINGNIVVNINGVSNADDVRGVLPELTDALRAAVGVR